MTEAIELLNLTKAYGASKAVDDLTLRIKHGSFVSILGPSGSGKSTTLMMLAGFEYPDQGRVLINGSDFTRTPPYERNLGMVFQNYALFPHLSVFENVAFPLRTRKMPKPAIKKAVDEALALVQLESFADRRPRDLSGGQQQRVAIARAIVFQSPILLMDEPLGALDRKLRQTMQIEIVKLQKRLGLTVIYVTHDQEEAMSMSDEVVILVGGKIEQQGTPAQLYQAPRTEFVARFLGESNILTSAQTTNVEPPAHGDRSRRYGLRPENVTICREASERSRRAVVKDVIYLGDSARCQVACPDGLHLWAKVPLGGASRAPAEGEEVWIGWRAEDLVSLHPEHSR